MNADLRGLVDGWRKPKPEDECTLYTMGVRAGRNECADALESRLEVAAISVAQGQGWLPIESAPATGLLLTFHPRFGQRILRPDPHNAGWYLDETGGPTREVTHWQPLPAAPAQPDGVSK